MIESRPALSTKKAVLLRLSFNARDGGTDLAFRSA